MLHSKKPYKKSRLSLQFSAESVEDDFDSGIESETQSTTSSAEDYDRRRISKLEQLEIMAHHLYSIAIQLDWTTTGDSEVDASANATVAVASEDRGMVVLRPLFTWHEDLLVAVIRQLDTQAILVMNNKITSQVHQRIPPMDNRLKLHDNDDIVIYETLTDILNIKHHEHSGFCLIRDTESVMLWSADAKDLVVQTRECERALTKSLYKIESGIATSQAHRDQTTIEEKHEWVPQVSVVEVNSHDLEKSLSTHLPVRLIWPITVSCTFLLMGLANGQLMSGLLVAILLDRTYHQVVFALYIPMACFLSAFFLAIIVVGVFQLIGPVSPIKGNSKTYSSTPPDIQLCASELPHITIELPVYKEGLWDVLEPTIQTVKAAIATYESQGGTASILVHDDGLQLLSSAERDERISYYSRRQIGWVARPPDDHNGFCRAGSFKKASNLNFGIRFSLAVEERFESFAEYVTPQSILYKMARNQVLAESPSGTLAAGDLGIGQIILLIDADTRVPKDCFLDAVKEFRVSPELAILQHPSGVLQVAHNFWEDSLAHFTRNNYFGTKYVVASGDTTPFFGHNAFLRFSALNDIVQVGPDSLPRWWSEKHVSEDFELSLKLLSCGYTSRMAGYSDYQFKEGVCLTVYDEINRWEKYAFGISELMFNPCSAWLRKGPFTPLFRQFLASRMAPAAKCSSIFYMATYYGIGLNWLLCVVNYILIGCFPQMVRSYYITSLSILMSTTVIFGIKDAIVGPFVRYRLQEVTLLRGFVDSLKYFVITALFLQGISMHVSKCLVWHLIGRQMSWTATDKSVSEDSTLKADLSMIWGRYRNIYVIVGLLTTIMVVLACAVPTSWKITDPSAIIPVAWMLFWHAAVPIIMHNRSFLADLYSRSTPVDTFKP